MTNEPASLSNDDISTGPTEDDENLDAPGEHSQDTGDEPTEDEENLDAEMALNQDALEKAGHWGVPTLVFEGEPFFGQDRIEMVQWRMEQKGLAKR